MTFSIKTAVTACVMCGAPLAAWRPLDTVVCQSPQCAGRHLALARQAKCALCTRPLSTAEMAQGHCGRPPCRDEVRRQRRAAEVARQQALVETLQRRRNRSAAQRGITREDAATYQVAVLPRNTDRPTRLPAERRARHEAHLRACLAEARELLAADAGLPRPATPEQPAPPQTPHARAVAATLLAGCAACRGQCCRQGKDHAFITGEQLVTLLQRHPDLDDDAVVTRYLAHIREITFSEGCVYQGSTGCTLDPSLRADICHQFLCGGLTMLKGAFREGEPVRAYLVHRRGEELRGDRFVEIARSDVSAPGPTGADGS
jgi:hypothetical protein